MPGRLVFWYEFASTYSYLSAMRIKEDAARAGVEVTWRPFFLGPIFKAQGWTTSPFNIYPAKGRYMVRDISRIAAARGLTFQMPAVFPVNSLKVARLAEAARDQGKIVEFSRAVYLAQFSRGADVADDGELSRAAEAVELNVPALFVRSGEQDIKDRVRASSDEAQAIGLFGAPSFTTPDGEIFWGDDRLDQALTWASTKG